MAEHHPKKQAGESRRGVDKHSVDVSEKILMFMAKKSHIMIFCG